MAKCEFALVYSAVWSRLVRLDHPLCIGIRPPLRVIPELNGGRERNAVTLFLVINFKETEQPSSKVANRFVQFISSKNSSIDPKPT